MITYLKNINKKKKPINFICLLQKLRFLLTLSKDKKFYGKAFLIHNTS